jgi:hypothetical protein
MGTLDVQTVNCDEATNTCQVHAPALGFALVFLIEVSSDPSSRAAPDTFSMSVMTKTIKNATVDAAVLAHSGSSMKSSSTSPGRQNRGISFRGIIPDMSNVAMNNQEGSQGLVPR